MLTKFFGISSYPEIAGFITLINYLKRYFIVSSQQRYVLKMKGSMNSPNLGFILPYFNIFRLSH